MIFYAIGQPMRIILLSVFFTFFSSGADLSSQTFILPPPVTTAMDSIVKIFIEGKKKPLAQEIGFIAKNSKNEIGVVTTLSIVDTAVYSGNSLYVLNKQTEIFPVKAVKNMSPIDGLIFLKIEGELGARPLPLAHSRISKENLFYTIQKKTWFNVEKVRGSFSQLGRNDFITESEIRGYFSSLILNTKGEVVSFAENGAAYTHYGTPLKSLKDLLRPSLYGSCVFIRGCIIKARKELYEKGRANNPKAQYRFLSLTAANKSIFKHLADSIGIKNLLQIQKDWNFFQKGFAQLDSYASYSFTGHKFRMSSKKKEKYFEFIAQNPKVKALAQKGHPHIQYVMGLLNLRLGFDGMSFDWFKKSREKQYIPSLFWSSLFEMTYSLTKLNDLAKQDYEPAQEFKKELISIVKKRPPHPKKEKKDIFLDLDKINEVLQKYEQALSMTVFSQTSSAFHFKENIEYLTAGFTRFKNSVEQGYTGALTILPDFNKKIQHLFEKNTALYHDGKASCTMFFFLPKPVTL